MRNKASFRLEVEAGRRYFPVTQDEKEILVALGQEMNFAIEIVRDLPADEGENETSARQLVLLDLPVPK